MIGDYNTTWNGLDLPIHKHGLKIYIFLVIDKLYKHMTEKRYDTKSFKCTLCTDIKFFKMFPPEILQVMQI